MLNIKVMPMGTYMKKGDRIKGEKLSAMPEK